MTQQIRESITSAEFFQLPASNLPIELIQGEIIMSPAPTTQHQRVLGKLHLLLAQCIPHGEIFLSPIDLYLDDANVVQPDIVWVAHGGNCTITPQRLAGPPALIVEVLSHGTRRRDLQTKFDLYQKHRVNEYWLVDPDEAYLEAHTLHGDRYQRLGVFGPQDTFTSPILARQLALEALFKPQNG